MGMERPGTTLTNWSVQRSVQRFKPFEFRVDRPVMHRTRVPLVSAEADNPCMAYPSVTLHASRMKFFFIVA